MVFFDRLYWSNPSPRGTDKPPLGLTPRFIMDENRLRNINAAMFRYYMAGIDFRSR